jgi:putative MATE family efflux protein
MVDKDKALTKSILKTSVPVMVGMLSHTFINAVDTAMVGRLGAADLAAAGIGGLAYLVIALTLAGLSIGVQAVTARRYGEGGFHDAGKTLANGIWIAVLTGLLLTLLGFVFASVLGKALFVSPETRTPGIDYLRFRFLGIFFFVFTAVNRGFFNGIGATRYYMYSALISGLANIFLDYGLIFGKLGLPRLEIKGAAIASTISEGLACLVYLVILAKPSVHRKYRFIESIRPTRELLSRLVKLSLPASIRTLLDMGAFLVFIWIIGLLGVTELAAANVIRSIAGFAFLPMFGLGIGASAILGQYLGAGKTGQAEETAFLATKMGAFFMAGCCILFWIVPSPLLSIYTNAQEVIQAGVWPLRIMGAGLFFASFAIMFSSCLQGAGNTKFVMWSTLLVISLYYLPFTWLLAVYLGFGISGAYVNEMIYWIIFSVIMYLKFKKGDWKKIKI